MKHLIWILFAASAWGQSLVTITDTLKNADGTAFAGKVHYSNAQMQCGTITVPKRENIEIPLTSGAFSVSLYATTQCLPAGAAYTIRYSGNGAQQVAYWTIPASSPTTVAAIQGVIPPSPSMVVALSQVSFGAVADGQFLKRDGLNWVGSAVAAGAWGTITGTLSAQSDLNSALAGKSATSHTHTGTYEPADANILKSSGSYSNPTWLTALAWTKITGVDAVPTISSGSGVPASTPTKLGDVYIDTDAEGITYIAECATTSGCWRAIGSGAATGLPNYSQAFTSQTSVALTHNAGTNAIIVQCYDGSGNVLEWDGLAKTDTNTATVTFSVVATGSCVVNASGGGGVGGSGDTTLVANTGAGAQVLKSATNVTARTLVAGSNVTVTQNTDTITIASTGGTGSITPGPTLLEASGIYNVNGAVIPMYLAGSASLTYGAISNGACGNQTFSLPGALNGDSIAAGWPASISAGFSGTMFVSATDTVNVRLCNHSGGSATPTAGLIYKAMIVRAF